jgi:galactokinase
VEYYHHDVLDKFQALYHTQPLLVRSPARINLIGEHTDYNDGFVMPAAIDKEIVFAISPSNDGQSRIYALNFQEEVQIDIAKPDKVKKPSWVNYLLGIIRQLNDRNVKLKPFNCVLGGNIPTGSGLSSSAALECGFVYALNELNKIGLEKIDMIKMAQWSEHNYAGVMCGIMDQFASMMGKKDQVIMLDCRSLQYQYFPIELSGYSIVLLDSNVKHSLADSEYNNRRKECEQGVNILKNHFPRIKSLRDVSLDMLTQHRGEFSDVVYSRCRYIVGEINRVPLAGQDLEAGDIKSFGARMYETHEGLSNLYEVSCEELDFLVAQAKQHEEVLGARMMGGGFGGCTINIVKDDKIEFFVNKVKAAYQQAFKIELLTYVVAVKDGSSIVQTEALSTV